MILNTLTGWYVAPVSQKSTHETVFSITFWIGLYVRFADGATRYFQPGIEYSITGYKRDGDGHKIMLNDSRQLSLDDPSQWTIRCGIETNSWGGAHSMEYDINGRNRRERLKAIRAGQAEYPFYTTVAREANPVFYVPVRPARNQPNAHTEVNAETAELHARLQS